MKGKVTNTEFTLFLTGVIFIGVFMFTWNPYVWGISSGILGSLNFKWYFSDIIDNWGAKRKYKYKGNTYIFNSYCHFKHPESREWIVAVNYSDKAGNQYIREISEFNMLFEGI